MNEKVEIDVGNVRGVTRKLDQLNRLTLPSEFLKSLGISKKATLETFLTEKGMYIRKVNSNTSN